MIRAANDSDLDEIVRIEAASFDDPWIEEDFRSFLEHPGVSFLVWDGGKVGGYVIFSCICGEAEIYNIAVAPDGRRRGIGRALVCEALKDADEAFLDVRVSNLPAMALYTELGFEKIGIRKNYYGGGEDAVVMKWRR